MDVRFDETNGSQREHLPNVLDEVSPSESIKLMGTREIIPSKAQAEEELIISAPNQSEDNAQPEVNAEAEENDLQGKIFVQYIPVLQMKYRLRRSLTTSKHLVHSLVQEQLNCQISVGTLHLSQYLNPRKLMKPSWNLNGFKLCKKSFNSSS